jgi:hypothetical protein
MPASFPEKWQNDSLASGFAEKMNEFGSAGSLLTHCAGALQPT